MFMDRIATKTLAEIYLQQGHLQEAYEIFKGLAERDPNNMEIKLKLEELSKQLNPSSPLPHPLPRSKEEKIRFLERWLVNIRERRRG
jgi:tetratricopeptide (TPR) repeat protein